MKTGGLSKCRLLAGEAGLDNAITCVDCMEVPNIESWLRSGELLITTGYALRDDEIAAVLSKLLQMPAAIVDGAGEILAASHIPDNFEDLEDYILQEVLGQGSAAERCPREARGYTVFSR